MIAVWEQLRTHFGGNQCNQVASHSTCANIKKANSLLSSAVVENGSVMDIVAADPPAKDDNRATWTRHADLDSVFI